MGFWPTGNSLWLHLPLEVRVFLLSVPVSAEAKASWAFGCLRGILPTPLPRETGDPEPPAKPFPAPLASRLEKAGSKPQTEQNYLKQAGKPHFMDRALKKQEFLPSLFHGAWLVVHVQPKLPGTWRRGFSAATMVLHVPSMFPALGNVGFVPETLKTTGLGRAREVSALDDRKTP